jgi:hypothetical protein
LSQAPGAPEKTGWKAMEWKTMLLTKIDKTGKLLTKIDKNGKRCCGDRGPSSTYASKTKTCPMKHGIQEGPMKHGIQEGPMIISLLYV